MTKHTTKQEMQIFRESRKRRGLVTSDILGDYAPAFKDPEFSMDPKKLVKNHNFLNPASFSDSFNYKTFFKGYILATDYGVQIPPAGTPQLYIAKRSPYLDGLDLAVFEISPERLRTGIPVNMALAIHNNGRPVFAGSYDYGIATINIPPTVTDPRAKWVEKLERLWEKYTERNAFEK